MRVDKGSFLQLVYPFLFDEESFARRTEAFEKAAWGTLGRPWTLRRKTVRDVLKHVGDYLNPPPGAPITAKVWDLDANALKSPQGLGAASEWMLELKQREIPFCIEGVQLALFHLGVGLLTLRIRPLSDDGADWLDLLHHARFADREGSGDLRIVRRVGIDPATRAPRYEPYFPPRCGGEGHAEGCGQLIDVLAGLLADGRLDEAADSAGGGRWWREVFVPGQLLPFAALFVRDVPEEEVPRTLFRVHNFFHAAQQLYPSSDDLDPKQQGLLPYAEKQWFAFSLDGGAFVAFDPPETPFFRETLPDHLADQYFLLFLLVLHQRFTLMKLSEDVSRNWRVEGEAAEGTRRDRRGEYFRRERVFRRIRDGLLSFTARGHFVQVMQRAHHHRCYRRWQETFQIAELYEEVDHEVHEMHEYLLLERTEHLEESSNRLQRRLDQIAMILGPPALILGYWDAVGEEGRLSVLLWTIGGLALGWLGWRIVSWGLREE